VIRIRNGDFIFYFFYVNIYIYVEEEERRGGRDSTEKSRARDVFRKTKPRCLGAWRSRGEVRTAPASFRHE